MRLTLVVLALAFLLCVHCQLLCGEPGALEECFDADYPDTEPIQPVTDTDDVHTGNTSAEEYPGERKDKELQAKGIRPISCLTACKLDACLKQESHKKAYKDCRLNCPAWRNCMASQKCSTAEALDMSCDRRDCIATDFCGNDCVAGNTIDISNLADEKCDCVRSCYVGAGYTPNYITCYGSKMYKDCYEFLKTGKL
ncbi:hypothetical protein F5H01DRAFT_351691 [Linnemannia elongata]|nr:hypothetical protein F5H01DRAFT_59708 [Linnemannia elongata]KAK5808256.1 hypothetical protein F5H01DRAFT_351691 [Linnemannia elongata]